MKAFVYRTKIRAAYFWAHWKAKRAGMALGIVLSPEDKPVFFAVPHGATQAELVDRAWGALLGREPTPAERQQAIDDAARADRQDRAGYL